LYNILTEFGIPMKPVRLIKMCLKETYIDVRLSNNLSNAFPIQNGLSWRCFITIGFQLYFKICYQKYPRKSDRVGTELNRSASGLF
jgi:hypothetical protein